MIKMFRRTGKSWGKIKVKMTVPLEFFSLSSIETLNQLTLCWGKGAVPCIVGRFLVSLVSSHQMLATLASTASFMTTKMSVDIDKSSLGVAILPPPTPPLRTTALDSTTNLQEIQRIQDRRCIQRNHNTVGNSTNDCFFLQINNEKEKKD